MCPLYVSRLIRPGEHKARRARLSAGVTEQTRPVTNVSQYLVTMLAATRYWPGFIGGATALRQREHNGPRS
jgi:hypothetical protein